MKHFKKALTILLASAMIVSNMSFNVSAAENDPASQTQNEISENDSSDTELTTVPETAEADSAADTSISAATEEINADEQVNGESEEEVKAEEDPVMLSATSKSLDDLYVASSVSKKFDTTKFMTIVSLDAGRKYFSVANIEAIIDEMAAKGYNTLELILGNDGLRLLLDDMSVTVDTTTYTSDQVTSAIQTGNKSYSDQTKYGESANELTETEMKSIISYANGKGISIIPAINSPGHMDAILDAATALTGVDCAYHSSGRTIDVTNATAVEFTQNLLTKYIEFFKKQGCTAFNMGADEYANDLSSSSNYYGFKGLQSLGKYSYFVKYVNSIAAIIKNNDMVPIAFNDGLYYNNVTNQGTFDTDIAVAYWTNGWSGYTVMSSANLAKKGHQIINTNSNWYYVLGSTGSTTGWSTWEHANQDTKNVSVTTTLDDSSSYTPVGSMMAIWCDTPSVQYSSTEKSHVLTLIDNQATATANASYFTIKTTVTYTASVSSNAVDEGKTISLSATASDNSDTSSTTWTSSDSSVLSINGTTATGVKAGNATLIATLPDNSTQTFTITVNAASGTDTSDTDKTIQTDTTKGSTVYQLDTDGIDSGAEYVIWSATGDRILYNVSGSSTTDQVTGTVSDSDYDSDTTITLANGFDESTQLWTVAKSGDGYTLKGNNSGTYLNLASTTSSNVNLNSSGSASGSVLTITGSGTQNTVSYSYTGTASYTSAGTISYSSNNNYSSYTGGSYYYKNGGNYVAITSLSCTRSWKKNNYNYKWTINGSITSSSSSLTYYTKSDGSGTNYLVHSSSSSTQFYTSASTTGNLLYFFKKTTTPGVTTYTADNSKLIELIAAANALTEGDYTAASWANLQTALTAANAIGTPSARDTESAAQKDQDKINTAAKNLNDAINALVKVQNIIVKVGDSKTVENLTGSLNTDSLDTTIATAELVNGTLTVTGVKEGLTSVTVGDQVYNINVKPAPVDIKTTPFTSGTTLGASGKVTKLTTSVGLSYDINIDSSVAASGGTWSIADTSIATVDSNGTVTGVAAGETTLTYTVNGETYTIPVVIRADATSTSSVKTYEFYVSEITDTTTYMAICNTTFKGMVEIQEGEAIYLSFATTDNTAIDFFAAPDEGYALTRMSSTNSAGDYMAVQRDVSASETDFYNNGAGASQTESVSIGATVLTQVIEAAQKLGCDGGMGWTRPSTKSDNVTSTLTFRSEKLPTVEKTVKSVGGADYTEGMNAKAGDKIVFTITVTKYACEDSVTYSDASLTDNLSGAVFSGVSSATKSITISSGTDAETQTFDVEYTVKDADLDTVITNTVDLNYTYKATYSSGSFGSTANAAAKVNALSFTPKDIVVDTGLPVTVDYSASDAHGRYDLSSDGAKATYGTVTVAGNKVTYTPDKVLTDIDTVTITNTKGTEYTFKVYPASTVYYEENFASMTGFAVNGNAENTGTTAQILGSSDAYGYETVYADDGVGASNGTQATSSAKGDRMTLTFKGTGIDVYANCTSSTGKAFVQVLKDGAAQKLAVVDTKTTGIYDIDDQSQYSLPIFSISGLPYGTYTVNVTAYTDTVINIDGFRVYNTLNDVRGTTSPYYADKEDGPVYYELHNELLFADTSSASIAYPQVLGTDSSDITAVALSSEGKLADIKTDGPKNELFLASGTTLTFKVKTTRQLQVGLKAVNAETSATINNTTSYALNCSTDMFYKVTNEVDSDGYQTVTIKNNGSGVLSVTKLKICDDPDFAFVPLTNDDLEDAYVALGLVEAPEVEMADAVCTVNLKDYAGNVIASSDLTANGVVADMGIFDADDIKAAAESVLPSGYAFVDESAVTDASVAYGETGSVDIQIGKVATLKITYKKGFKTVGTATLTHIQTIEGSKYTFSTSEIKAAAPSGLRVISLWGTSVNYGSTKSITATGR